jgi:hypothetical protein
MIHMPGAAQNVWHTENPKQTITQFVSTIDDANERRLVLEQFMFECVIDQKNDCGEHVHWLATTWGVDVNADKFLLFSRRWNTPNCARALIFVGARISYGSISEAKKPAPANGIGWNIRWGPTPGPPGAKRFDALRMIVHYGGDHVLDADGRTSVDAWLVLRRLRRARSAVVAWLGVQRRLRYAHLHKGPVAMIGQWMWERRTSTFWEEENE